MQQVDLYCKKCKKSMKMSYMVSGDKDAPVLTGITIRCHTNKCIRVVMLKNFTGRCKGQMLSVNVIIRHDIACNKDNKIRAL